MIDAFYDEINANEVDVGDVILFDDGSEEVVKLKENGFAYTEFGHYPISKIAELHKVYRRINSMEADIKPQYDEVYYSELQEGDLVFYHGTDGDEIEPVYQVVRRYDDDLHTVYEYADGWKLETEYTYRMNLDREHFKFYRLKGEVVNNFEEDLDGVLNDIRELLLEKNRKYGDSALNPSRIFSKASAVEQIRVRIDDKLTRMKNRQNDDDEDLLKDLLGYLVLLAIAENR